MGQTWSSAPPTDGSQSIEAVQRRAALATMSQFELMSLRKHLSQIQEGKTSLPSILGIQNLAGSSIVLRMARNLAFNNLARDIVVAIGWFDGRLADATGESDLHWRRRLFQAASATEIGQEPILHYEELSELVQLLVSAFDWDPTNWEVKAIQPISMKVIDDLLEGFRTPAIRFNQFDRLLAKYPFLLVPLTYIWRRLLLDNVTVVTTAVEAVSHESALLTRQTLATLYVVLGPQVFGCRKVFQGSTDGFSMRGFEQSVTDWPSSSLLLVKGHSPKDFAKSWASKSKRIDELIPRYHDVPLRLPKRILVALYVEEPWRSSYKKCFGGTHCQIVTLEPQIQVSRLLSDHVFLSPSIALGAGLTKPPATNEHVRGTALLVDENLEHAVLQRLADDEHENHELRFYLDEIEVLGCEPRASLEARARLEAWEKRAAEQVATEGNMEEDKSILKLAGLYGQYGDFNP